MFLKKTYPIVSKTTVI